MKVVGFIIAIVLVIAATNYFYEEKKKETFREYNDRTTISDVKSALMQALSHYLKERETRQDVNTVYVTLPSDPVHSHDYTGNYTFNEQAREEQKCVLLHI